MFCRGCGLRFYEEMVANEEIELSFCNQVTFIPDWQAACEPRKENWRRPSAVLSLLAILTWGLAPSGGASGSCASQDNKSRGWNIPRQLDCGSGAPGSVEAFILDILRRAYIRASLRRCLQKSERESPCDSSLG